MEIKNKINEKHFNLEIYEWDDFTLDLLKSYSDWKTYNMKTEGSKDFTPPLFSNDEILCNESEYGSINLYKPVLKHILDNTGVHFFKTEITNLIYNLYHDHNRILTKGSAGVYSDNYCKYMIDKEIARRYRGGFDKIKKNQNLKVKS